MSHLPPMGAIALSAFILFVPFDLAAEELSAGTVFQDCAECPEMVVVDQGAFQMGDMAGIGRDFELPVHEVEIAYRFSVGRYEVTFEEWDHCVADGGCGHSAFDENLGRGRRAVRNVNWADAQEYVSWLSGKTGKTYRLLTEAEWEYMARAGSQTIYPWGDEVGSNMAVCSSCGVASAFEIEVGQLLPNQFGIYDTVGSEREWLEDCWNRGYEGAPTDGSAWIEGDCSRRVVRGGAFYDSDRNIRSASRTSAVRGERVAFVGFRVARDL